MGTLNKSIFIIASLRSTNLFRTMKFILFITIIISVSLSNALSVRSNHLFTLSHSDRAIRRLLDEPETTADEAVFDAESPEEVEDAPDTTVEIEQGFNAESPEELEDAPDTTLTEVAAESENENILDDDDDDDDGNNIVAAFKANKPKEPQSSSVSNQNQDYLISINLSNSTIYTLWAIIAVFILGNCLFCYCVYGGNKKKEVYIDDKIPA